jgi:metal-responsive CopG/Arc/MetJ family transcriptional regulator
MNSKMADKRGQRPERPSRARASVSLPDDPYNSLGEIAKETKVPLARVVRDAAEKYVALQRPHSGDRG